MTEMSLNTLKRQATIDIVSEIGREIARLGNAQDVRLDELLLNPQLATWFIPALQFLKRERKTNWMTVLQMLDLQSKDGDLLAIEEREFADSTLDNLILLAATEIMSGTYGKHVSVRNYIDNRSASAPSYGYLALRNITWDDVQQRLYRLQRTASVATAAQVAATVSQENNAHHVANQIVRPNGTSFERVPAQAGSISAPNQADPSTDAATAIRKAATADRVRSAIKPRNPNATGWLAKHPDATRAEITAAVLHQMIQFGAFDPSYYRLVVDPIEAPLPAELNAQFGPKLWFDIQDAYIEQFSVMRITTKISERNWRVLPAEELVKRMHKEAKRLGLTSEFAFNSRRHPALSPTSMIVRQICQEQDVNYIVLRNRYFGRPTTKFVGSKPRAFTTFPLEYVVRAFHEELIRTNVKTLEEYDLAFDNLRAPSLRELSRVAARNGLDAETAYKKYYDTPIFPN
mgnify:CR=1 FL=1